MVCVSVSSLASTSNFATSIVSTSGVVVSTSWVATSGVMISNVSRELVLSVAWVGSSLAVSMTSAYLNYSFNSGAESESVLGYSYSVGVGSTVFGTTSSVAIGATSSIVAGATYSIASVATASIVAGATYSIVAGATSSILIGAISSIVSVATS